MVARLTGILFHPLFMGCVIVYFLIRYLRSLELALPDWINGQVTDLVCMPIVLMLCLALTRVIKRNSHLEIQAWLIALICVEYALIFEWFLPERSAIYTGDWKDVFMYALGGIAFYFMQPLFRPKTKLGT